MSIFNKNNHSNSGSTTDDITAWFRQMFLFIDHSLCIYLYLSLCTQNFQERMQKWRNKNKCEQYRSYWSNSINFFYFAIKSSYMLREWVCVCVYFSLYIACPNEIQFATIGMKRASHKTCIQSSESLLKIIKKDGARILVGAKRERENCQLIFFDRIHLKIV